MFKEIFVGKIMDLTIVLKVNKNIFPKKVIYFEFEHILILVQTI